jgi:hypothetical protein
MFIHAAGMSACSPTGPAHNPETYALALEAPDLERVASLLDQHQIPFFLFHEPDEPWCGKLLAIGIPPIEQSKLKPITKRLNLYPKEKQLCHESTSRS